MTEPHNPTSQQASESSPQQPDTLASAPPVKPPKPPKNRKGIGGPTPFERNPAKVRAAVCHAVETLGSTHKAAPILGVPQRTLTDIVTRSAGELPLVKKELAGQFAVVAEESLAVARSLIPKLKTPMEAITFTGIATDKVAKLTESVPTSAPQLNVLFNLAGGLQTMPTVELVNPPTVSAPDK